MAKRIHVGCLGLLVLAAAVVIAPTAQAQRGDSGSIVGYVFDQTGLPIAGVKVTASSDTQIGGKKVTYTNGEGHFRFPVVEPGVFQVRTDSLKLKTQVLDNVKVGINAPTELNVIMEVATKTEEVQVVQKAPLVSTTTANVKEVYDIDMVNSMPHDNRDIIYSQVTNYSAGTIKGGRIRGGAGNQTIYSMDGFNMLRQYPTLKASAAYEIQTAAYGAENAMAPGGMVNLVTRSGSNKFEFEVDATAENDKMRFFQTGTDPKASSFFYIINPTVSGPIIKDKVWYSLNTEFLAQKTGREGDVEGIFPEPLPEQRRWFKGTAKVAWQITPRNKLQSVTNFDEWWQGNRTAGLGYDITSQARGRSRKYFTGLIWESLLTDSIVFRSQIGLSTLNNRFYPSRCDDEPDTCDHIAGITQREVQGQLRTAYLENSQLHQRDDAYSFQFINRLEFFFITKHLGEHNIQIKDNFMAQQDIFRRSVPGDRVFEVRGTVKEAETTFYSNDPTVESARYGWYITTTNSSKNSLSIQDSWRLTRHLTITPGLAFTTAIGENSQRGTVIKGNALTPSLTTAWDPTHDGRTVLRASFAQYVDVDVSPIASHNLGTQVQRRCLYNDSSQAYDRECVYSGGASGATVGLPCGPTGLKADGQPCKNELTLPKTWEYTIGAEREVTDGLSLSVDGIWRKFYNQFEKYETNRIWNGSGTQLAPTGGYRNGRAIAVSDLETSDDAHRRYMGVTIGATRREGRLKMHGAYTLSRLDGTVLEGTANRLGDIAPRDVYINGSLPDDHRHEFKVNANYAASNWLSFGVRYSYYSGLPYSRLYRNDTTGAYENLRARVGVSPGTDTNDPGDDRELRMPDIHSLNAQVIFNLLPFTGQKVEAFMDVLNVLGLRTPNTVSEQDNDFGVVRATELPLRARVGVRYRY
jgi:hypothetical protein